MRCHLYLCFCFVVIANVAVVAAAVVVFFTVVVNVKVAGLLVLVVGS